MQPSLYHELFGGRTRTFLTPDFFFLDFFSELLKFFRNSHVVAYICLPAVRPWTAIHARGLKYIHLLESRFPSRRLLAIRTHRISD